MKTGAWWASSVAAGAARSIVATMGIPFAAAPPADTEYGIRFDTFLATNPELYGAIERRTFNPPDELSLGPDGSADMVVTFRSTHGWINRGFAPAVYQAMFDVLLSRPDLLPTKWGGKCVSPGVLLLVYSHFFCFFKNF